MILPMLSKVVVPHSPVRKLDFTAGDWPSGPGSPIRVAHVCVHMDVAGPIGRHERMFRDGLGGNEFGGAGSPMNSGTGTASGCIGMGIAGKPGSVPAACRCAERTRFGLQEFTGRAFLAFNPVGPHVVGVRNKV